MPKVSIVLPTYNGSQYLRESINSILAQTFSDWELIIVNDCSTDMTPEIIKEYNEIDHRIRVIHNKENKRLPRSLNIGFSQATGEYLTWTSDDNRYHEDAIAKMVNYLDEHSAVGMVCCNMFCIDEKGNIIEKRMNDPKNLWVYDSVGACFMYRKSVKDKIGEYNPDMFLSEDYDYWLRINKVYRIGNIPEYLYFYRYHEKSLTGSRKKNIQQQSFKLKMKYFEEIINHLVGNIEGLLAVFAELWYADPLKTQKLCKYFREAGLTNDMMGVVMKPRLIDNNKQYILFGCGAYGQKAIKYFGEKNIYCFVDNDVKKQGMNMEGKQIISCDRLREIYHKYNVIICVDLRKAYMIALQLEQSGIHEYSVFESFINK